MEGEKEVKKKKGSIGLTRPQPGDLVYNPGMCPD